MGLNNVSKTFYVQESLYSGDYTLINSELCDYMVQLENDFKWTPTGIKNNTTTFKTPFVLGSGSGFVRINFNVREIRIDSWSEVKTVWIKKQLKQNEENCNTVIRTLPDYISKFLKSDVYRIILDDINEKRLKEEKRLEELQVSQTNVLSDLDKDGNGEVDVVEGNDFNTLLKKHQKTIVKVDRNYVQQFVKVSSYLKTKKGNIQSIFNSIKDTPNQEVLNEYVEILRGEIHTYNLVLFNSLNMIVSLIEDDMITFYEIYEMFDSINMFDSKHEKDVSQKLTNIGDGLKSLMDEIRVMGNKITNAIQELSYVTEQSNQQLTEQLNEIDSSIQTNNLLTSIQTYQLYNINKNTKGIRG